MALDDQPNPETAAPDNSVEGRLDRIEYLLHQVLEELQRMTGAAGQGRGLGH